MVTASAPGKLLLLGEHAVVYGYPAMVVAIDKYVQVSVEKSNRNSDEITLFGSNDNRFVITALQTFREKFKINDQLKIKTQSTFSNSVGFGSSAATVVATIKALTGLFSIPLSNRELFEISFDAHKKCQTSGSGVDIAASVYGGILYYDNFGEKIEKLPIKSILIVVGYSGTKADTNKMINDVAQLFKNKFQETEQIFKEISKCVKNGKQFLMAEDFKNFGLLMNKNQILLDQLGVSTDQLDTMIEMSVRAGAWGAKLSGAGGGDCMIALVTNENKQSVTQAINLSGGQIIDISVSPLGVQII